MTELSRPNPSKHEHGLAASGFTWLGEAQQGQVDVLAFLLARDDEVKNLEVLAADDQRGSSSSRGGGGRQFLHTAHQTVENLGETASPKCII